MLAEFRSFAPWLSGFAVLAAAAGSRASELRDTFDFAEAVRRVGLYAQQYGAADTLLVVDIDNTLLAMSSDLGSDQWFEWQEYLLRCEPESDDLVAPTFDGLLEAQGLLFTLGKMHPPQKDLPELVRGVQQLGVPTLVLTSRGEQFRLATERELRAAGYDFAQSAMATDLAVPGRFLPYDRDRPDEAGFSPPEVEAFGLGQPKECTYSAGVFMTSGQHKGAMLLSMLGRARHKPRAIVYVDDHTRHAMRVFDALIRRGVEASVFHYRREEDHVFRFRYDDKSDVTKRWRRLEGALREVFAYPDQAPAAKP